MFFFPSQGSLIEDIKKLQEAEEQVNHRLVELTQKKESFSVRQLVLFLSALPFVVLLPTQR